MSGERALAWTVGVAAAVVAVLAFLAPATPPAQLLVAGLGAVVVLPLAYVLIGWLYSFRSIERGWS